MKVGIVANEFFDARLGRMGGFGWVAWAAGRALREVGGHEVVFLTTEFSVPRGRGETGGSAIITPRTRTRTGAGAKADFARRIRQEKLDLFLTVDWRPHYTKILLCAPRTPALVWVQDPRTTFDVRRVDSLRLPGTSSQVPAGIGRIDCTGLRNTFRFSHAVRRPIAMAGHAHYLEDKLEGTYGFRTPEYGFLPDPIRFPNVQREPSSRPSVVFLGRTDPVKRPWLFFELAERNPEISFYLLGQMHFSGQGTWQTSKVPSNMRLTGHVGEDEKFGILRRAWALVNTSIHEALPISFLEALSCEVPIVSMQNPDELASRFGSFAGRWDGDGSDGLDYLDESLHSIIGDEATRDIRGLRGRQWLEQTHNENAFVEALVTQYESMLK